jgi:hypothetical protein
LRVIPMSESNAPFNNHNEHSHNEPKDEAPLAWRDPFTGMYEAEDSDMSALFSSLAAEDMTRANAPDVTATEARESSQPPELADLVSLIQELNQCNSALLDRVSQLEEALEQSHGSLALVEPPDAPMPQDLPKAQEHITTLYNQLEASQERVAQLERETSLVQQRYTDQAQSIAQSESNCRDLQARLHRQQRYTLQFKAALEKCLEVPMPQYEGQDAPSAQTAGDYLFLPKAQRIKPWAAQSNAMPGKMPWMNLTTDALADFEPSPESELANERLNLPAFTLPELQVTQMESAQVLAEPMIEEIQPLIEPTEPTEPTEEEDMMLQALVASILRGTEEPVALTSSFEPVSEPVSEPVMDGAAMDHISAVVQPLADLIAEAMLAEPFPIDALQPLSPVPELKAPEPASMVSEPAQPIAPLPMADAEDALWQDLARLIDVSTEDVVKASLSGDFAAFEAIDFAALENKAAEPSVEHDPWDGAVAPAPMVQAEVQAEVQAGTPVQIPEPQPAEAPAPQPAVPKKSARKSSIKAPLTTPTPTMVPSFVATSQNSPSPLVYPLRPPKKRQSLAMVELPDFRRPQAANPMPT